MLWIIILLSDSRLPRATEQHLHIFRFDLQDSVTTLNVVHHIRVPLSPYIHLPIALGFRERAASTLSFVRWHS